MYAKSGQQGEVPEVQELDDANKEEEQSNMNGAYSG
jgi:hypothetical protein